MKSESGHTPGKWQVDIDRRDVLSPGMNYIARCGESRMIPETEMEANARLIAAAPDLLEALRNCVTNWKSLGGEAALWLTEADAAIAKATVSP